MQALTLESTFTTDHKYLDSCELLKGSESWDWEDTTDEEGEASASELRSDEESTEDEEDGDSSCDDVGGSDFVDPEASDAGFSGSHLSPPGLHLPAPGLMAPPPGLAFPPADVSEKVIPVPPLDFDLGANSQNTTCDSEASTDIADLCGEAVMYSPPTPRHDRPDQTIMFLDWDDTICPTTVCGSHVPYGSDADGSGGGAEPQPMTAAELEKIKPALDNVVQQAIALFTRASELADKVVIVTNAGEGWVEWSCSQWLPELLPFLDNIEVVSARSTWEPYGITSPTSWKELTFREQLMKFYSQYADQTWKNIVCVGDAPYEHDALTRVVNYQMVNQAMNNIRCKNIKFMPQPSVEDLARQLQRLEAHLGDIVAQNSGLYEVYSKENL